jgi:hypothetical protein
MHLTKINEPSPHLNVSHSMFGQVGIGAVRLPALRGPVASLAETDLAKVTIAGACACRNRRLRSTGTRARTTDTNRLTGRVR